MVRVSVTKIPHLNVLVIKQTGGNYFVATKDSIVIDIPGLSYLLKYLLICKAISPKLLEGVLEEYNSYGADERYRNNEE